MARELIWQGRLHLGDEPGVYGDAAYTGLVSEIPVTVTRSDPNATSFKFVLETVDIQTFQGYPGHLIEVIQYLPDPAQAYHSIEKIVSQARFSGADNNRKEVVVSVGSEAGHFRFSVRLRCDTTVNPGLYDEFVWRRLGIVADSFAFYASL
jgi:hypothetical protein